jgi:hypothetical protein
MRHGIPLNSLVSHSAGFRIHVIIPETSWTLYAVQQLGKYWRISDAKLI